MNESLEELKAIIDNAPEGATHADNAVSYYKMDSYGNQWGIWKGVWCVCVGCNTMRMPPSMRSLSDIKRIIELMELNQNMHTTVAGYIYGKDWDHWNEFNRGKFKL